MPWPPTLHTSGGGEPTPTRARNWVTSSNSVECLQQQAPTHLGVPNQRPYGGAAEPTPTRARELGHLQQLSRVPTTTRSHTSGGAEPTPTRARNWVTSNSSHTVGCRTNAHTGKELGHLQQLSRVPTTTRSHTSGGAEPTPTRARNWVTSSSSVECLQQQAPTHLGVPNQRLHGGAAEPTPTRARNWVTSSSSVECLQQHAPTHLGVPNQRPHGGAAEPTPTRARNWVTSSISVECLQQHAPTHLGMPNQRHTGKELGRLQQLSRVPTTTRSHTSGWQSGLGRGTAADRSFARWPRLPHGQHLAHLGHLAGPGWT